MESQCTIGDVDNTHTVNPMANFSTTTREDCAFCLSPATINTIENFSHKTDSVTHCLGKYIYLHLLDFVKSAGDNYP